jgi:hypothetical protein
MRDQEEKVSRQLRRDEPWHDRAFQSWKWTYRRFCKVDLGSGMIIEDQMR